MHQIENNKLEGAARAVIEGYLSLPVGARPSCPYFNNRRRRMRGGLRVLKGKGTPAEIAQECSIFATLDRLDIASLSTDKLKEYLVSKDLGVDCSGFAYHVLDAFIRERNGRPLRSAIQPVSTGIFGRVRALLRPAENTGVSSFRNERNSFSIQASEARPGDFITFMGTGRDKNYNHILVVTGVDKIGADMRLSYAHSYAWPSEGRYGHGVREGEILVHGNDLMGGTWKERGEIGENNYTLASAKSAAEVSLRRLHALRSA